MASRLRAFLFAAFCGGVFAAFPLLAQVEPSGDVESASGSTTDGGFLGNETAERPASEPVDFTRAVVNVLVALIVVLALVIGLSFFFKKMSYRLRTTGGGAVTVLAQVPLGPTQFLSVVQIGSETLVLGVTEHSVTAISELDDPEVIEALRRQPSPRSSAGTNPFLNVPSFRQFFHRAPRGDGS